MNGIREGFIVRFFAYLVDQVILSFMTLISMIAVLTSYSLGIKASGGSFFFNQKIIIMLFYILITLINMLYYTYFHGSSGQTIGKRIFRIKVVGVRGEIIGYRRAFIRWMGYIISSFLYLGFLWIIFDREKQGWHDKLARTYVIKI